MKFINNKRKKYLILLPMVFLLLNAFYFMYATKEIKNALLQEKYVETAHAVDMLYAAVEATVDREWCDHKLNIRDSIEYLDTLYQIFAAAYKVIDGNLVIFTERVYETSPLEPLERDEFIQAVFSNEKGSIVLGDTPKDQQYREVHLYYRWMPLYSPPSERYLVVIGVSTYSVTAKVALWVSGGQWASMLITFVINVWFVILLARLNNPDKGTEINAGNRRSR